MARALGPLLRLLASAGRVPRAAAAAGLVDGCLSLLSPSPSSGGGLAAEPLAALPLLDAVAAMYAAASSPRAFIAAHGPEATLRRVAAGCGGGGVAFGDGDDDGEEVEREEGGEKEASAADAAAAAAVGEALRSASESDSDSGSSDGDEEHGHGFSPSPPRSYSPAATAAVKGTSPLRRKTSPPRPLPAPPVFSTALTAGETEVRARANALLKAFRINAAL